MGRYFPEAALQQLRDSNEGFGSLETVVRKMPVQLKQALLAAAEVGYLRGGTWNGCAMNVAAKQTGKGSLKGSVKVSAAFGANPSVIEEFISIWDGKNLNPRGRATVLKRALINVGISTPPDAYRGSGDAVRVINETVYKGEATRFQEQLADASTLGDLGFSDDEIEAARDLMQNLLVPA